jgi:hypothetical protein
MREVARPEDPAHRRYRQRCGARRRRHRSSFAAQIPPGPSGAPLSVDIAGDSVVLPALGAGVEQREQLEPPLPRGASSHRGFIRSAAQGKEPGQNWGPGYTRCSRLRSPVR